GNAGTDYPVRAWVNPPLNERKTPIVLIFKRCLTNQGNKRDLAHELGHVLIRWEGHPRFHFTGDYLMDQGVTPGEDLEGEWDRDRVRRYPNVPYCSSDQHCRLFLLDTSGSMQGARIQEARQSIEQVVRAGTGGPDRPAAWALLTFSQHNVFVQQPFT